MKYYVWNDKIKVVCSANSPAEAVAISLSLYAFNRPETYPDGWCCRDDVDRTKITWPFFAVSTNGWRAYDGTTIEIDQNVYITQFPETLVTVDIGVDYFHSLMNEYDPFCENEDYNEN